MSGSDEEPGGRRKRPRLAAVLTLVPGAVMILLGTLMAGACAVNDNPDDWGCVLLQGPGLLLLLAGVGLSVLVVVMPRND